ncbi:MAG: response regulator transcription factor [Erysipelothrix sp.]|nr:response regulator transcription factor [Erysipelothrix sp.]
MNKILIVDDEAHIVEFLQLNLERNGWQTIIAKDGEAAIQKAIKHKPDCILLDIMMPKVNGFEVCRRIKEIEETKLIPVIIITAKSEESDMVLGLNLGADDYIVKPFRLRELFARIDAVTRRFQNASSSQTSLDKTIDIGDLKIDLSRYSVTVDKTQIHLTPNEFNILLELANNLNKLTSRTCLFDSLDSDETSDESRTIDVHISNLRKKIKSDKFSIETIRGKGFILNG